MAKYYPETKETKERPGEAGPFKFGLSGLSGYILGLPGGSAPSGSVVTVTAMMLPAFGRDRRAGGCPSWGEADFGKREACAKQQGARTYKQLLHTISSRGKNFRVIPQNTG
jgi:hypothetical protein